MYFSRSRLYNRSSVCGRAALGWQLRTIRKAALAGLPRLPPLARSLGLACNMVICHDSLANRLGERDSALPAEPARPGCVPRARSW